MTAFFALPMLVLIFAFVFIVLLMLLAGKTRKAGVGVLIAVIFLLVGGVFIGFPLVTHRRVVYESHGPEHPTATALVESGRSVTLPTVSPIWSEGVEDEFDADVYPSRSAAMKALAPRLREWIDPLVADVNQPPGIVLFQQDQQRALVWDPEGGPETVELTHDYQQRTLMWDLERALEGELPTLSCSIEAGQRNLGAHEIGITLHIADLRIEPVPWSDGGPRVVSGRLVAEARYGQRETTVAQSFFEKPWVEGFADFVNARSDRHYLIARSQEACTGEGEAKRQAEEDACAQLMQQLDRIRPAVPGQSSPTVTPTELVRDGFVADRFVQSFDGMAGRVWRQALLIDISPQKLMTLSTRLHVTVERERVTWARMIVSSLGVFVVILVAYLFLNMATRGYYDWSLRIAGLVLVIIAVIFIFHFMS